MSASLGFSFIVLIAVLYSTLVIGITYAEAKLGSRSRLPIYVVRIVVGGFILVTGLSGMSGFFTDFASMPPKIFLGVAPAFIGMLVLAFHRRMGEWLRVIPHWWILALQSFRLIVEIQLHYLAKGPLFPKMMTFEGANFDILVGVTAPLVAFISKRAGDESNDPKTRKLIFMWNVFGLLLLTNVVSRGILAMPTQFQVLMTEPPNSALGYFPYIWLPMFAVPFAYFLHILSLRKLRMDALKGA